MNVSELNTDEKNLFASIHNNILPNRKKDFDTKGILSGKNLKSKTLVEPIIKKTKQLLDMFNKTNYDFYHNII